MNTLLGEIIATLERGGITGADAEATSMVRAAQVSAPANHSSTARAMAERRATGTPLAYVTGYKMFMGIELLAVEGALILREETEFLGNAALDFLRSSGTSAPRLIDMCCGSGNLACAIAHHMPAVQIWASDLTDSCISITRRNIEHMGVSDRVVAAQGDLFAGLAGLNLEGTIDAIVCGPPFISQKKLATDSAWLLKYEPREAFDGGPYGLSIQQRVIKEALPFLRPGGTLFFENGLGQERQTKMLFDRTKAYDDIQLVADTSGAVRVISARKRAE